MSLVLVGKQSFPLGGRLIVKSTPPNGVTDPSGNPLVGNTAFAIRPNARGFSV